MLYFSVGLLFIIYLLKSKLLAGAEAPPNQQQIFMVML